MPLSKSPIWRRQREFYVQRGLGAWTADKVPQFITNNPFIAEIYAGIVFHFLRECIEQNDGAPISAGHPLNILELGAGTGKFAYLFLRHLAPLMSGQGIPLQAVRYHLTDCSQRVLESWRANTQLAEFVQCGMLEFHQFEAGNGIVGEAGPVHGASPGPLVVVANYVFDSLPQDAFAVHQGEVFEFLVNTTTPAINDGHDPGHGSASGAQPSWQRAAAPAQPYSNANWNQILEEYRSSLPGATFLFPSAVLQTLDELARLSDGRMLVLAADKGHAYEDVLALVQPPPRFEWHAPDCFSLMVNFDAIGKYFRTTGGHPLLPDKHFSGLNICGFLRGRAKDAFPATVNAYRKTQMAFGPDDLFTLLAWLDAHMDEMTVPQILAALRLTRWDPIALIRLFPVLGRQLRNVVPERYDLRDAVLRTWANHYPVEPGENVLAFECGVILLELRFFSEAVEMFKTSQRVLGPSMTTSYNLGLCAQGLGNSAEALRWMVEASNLDPQFESAQSARARLEKQIGQTGSGS